jgi:2-iminobutanoate/2-iminopropanoate deaminase
MGKLAIAVTGMLLFSYGSGAAQQVSPNGVTTLAPAGAIKPTGTWNLGTRAGDFIFVAGMRGIDPKTDTLVQGDEARIRQAFLNMKLIAESEGATLQDAVRLVVFVTDMYRFRPLVNKVQSELWGQGPYPPRTIIEVDRLNQDDIAEVEGTFYAPRKRAQIGSETTGQQAGGEVDKATFDRFLAANPRYRQTPPSERERLFREFQDWRRTQR